MNTLPINIESIDLSVDNKELHLQFTTYGNTPLKIVIDNQKTFICKNEYSENAYVYNISPSEYTESAESTYDANITINLPETDVVFIPEIEDNLYFVYIYSDGEEEPYLEAVVPVYNEPYVYTKVFNVIKKDYADCVFACKESNNGVSAIIALKGLEYALIVGDYRKAIMFWNIINTTTSTVTNNCNCG